MTANPSAPPRELSITVDSVDPEKMKVLALLLADPNPIHFDVDAAARTGIADRQVNQGPSTIGMVYNLFAERLPGYRVQRLQVRLKHNVLAADEVRIVGTRTDDGDDDAPRYDVTVTSSSRGVAIAGVAQLIKRAG